MDGTNLKMRHFKTLILALLTAVSGFASAEKVDAQGSETVVLEATVDAQESDAPTVALTPPDDITTEILLDGETRTISQCETELEVKKEIYNVAYWLRGTTNDEELWDSLSPAAQSMIGNDLSEITMWAAEDDFRTNHMICHQLHPNTFPEWSPGLLTAAIESQKPEAEEAILRHRIPVTLNQAAVPEAYQPDVVLRGDGAGGSLDLSSETPADSATD